VIISLISKPPVSLPVVLHRFAREINSSASYALENETAAVRAILKESRLAFWTSPIPIFGYKEDPLSFRMVLLSSNLRVTYSAA
tara:strand:- start:565 stop:816 length:252 start_codon:yes stop_codon:yes gene_type:complete